MFEGNFHPSFYLLCSVQLWIAVRGLLGGRTIFAYPTLAAIMGLAWIVPQGIEIESSPRSFYGSEAFWLYVTACFVCIAVGFRIGSKIRGKRTAGAPDWETRGFSNKRLLIAAGGLAALGQVAAFQMSSIDTSGMGKQWTGVITMWALLGKASGFGLCLAVLVFARTRRWEALAIAAVATVPLIQAAIFGVRREILFDLVILTVGAWYFAKQSYPPRAATIAGLFVGAVILNSVGDIRARVISGEESFIEVMTSAGIYEEFDYRSLGQGDSSEIRLAQYDFQYVNKSDRWELGAEHWNSLIHQYVPAFIFGRELKESLQISTLNRRLTLGEERGAFSLGSTRTGFSDSYRAFGFFGVTIFLLIGSLFGTLYGNAAQGNIRSQYLYLVLTAEGLLAITHSTGAFVASLPFTLGLSFVVFKLSSVSLSGRPRLGVDRATDAARRTR